MSKVDDWTLTQALLSSNIKQPVFSLKKWDIIKTQYIQYIQYQKTHPWKYNKYVSIHENYYEWPWIWVPLLTTHNNAIYKKNTKIKKNHKLKYTIRFQKKS